MSSSSNCLQASEQACISKSNSNSDKVHTHHVWNTHDVMTAGIQPLATGVDDLHARRADLTDDDLTLQCHHPTAYDLIASSIIVSEARRIYTPLALIMKNKCAFQTIPAVQHGTER